MLVFRMTVFAVVCVQVTFPHLISCATIETEKYCFLCKKKKRQHVHSRNISVISNFCQIHKALTGPVVQI